MVRNIPQGGKAYRRLHAAGRAWVCSCRRRDVSDVRREQGKGTEIRSAFRRAVPFARRRGSGQGFRGQGAAALGENGVATDSGRQPGRARSLSRLFSPTTPTRALPLDGSPDWAAGEANMAV